jgi:glyoxylase-like metal-dependent hydrolase (beta-lactamase superfamily II)
MRHLQPGKIVDNLWYLGREEAGVYVLESGRESIMINGGLNYILPDVLEQMRTFGIDANRIKKLLILHSHFDHVGIVPHFKRTYPGMEVIASKTAWQIFAMPKAQAIINSFGQIAAKQMGYEEALRGYDMEWRDDITGTSVGEGDSIDLGGIALKIYDTPGHSNCSITAYEPGMKALFASDAVGVLFKDMIFPSMNTNVTQYLESLQKLKPLPVAYVCADHCGYVTGEEAEGFVVATIVEGEKWKGVFEDLVRRHGGNIDAAAKEILDNFFREYPDYFIVPEIMEGVFKQMLKFISKTMQ